MNQHVSDAPRGLTSVLSTHSKQSLLIAFSIRRSFCEKKPGLSKSVVTKLFQYGGFLVKLGDLQTLTNLVCLKWQNSLTLESSVMLRFVSNLVSYFPELYVYFLLQAAKLFQSEQNFLIFFTQIFFHLFVMDALVPFGKYHSSAYPI